MAEPGLAYPKVRDLAPPRGRHYEEMAAVRTWVINLSGGDHPEALVHVVDFSGC